VAELTSQWDPNLPLLFLCYTYSGIAKARDNPPLLVFTDADAKDANRLQEVIDAAIAKNISVTSLLTNQCSRRKRSDLGMLLFFINYISNKYKNSNGRIYNFLQTICILGISVSKYKQWRIVSGFCYSCVS
jgi:hypothetical protein